MEFVTMIMAVMNNIFEQVFEVASNDVLKEWGVKTVESIADKALQNMPQV
ncbi:hypothetical protein [Nitrosarchaeum sp. AC2]|nr:hypothetical protein [Nitrosarchaeum sp. AC2]